MKRRTFLASLAALFTVRPPRRRRNKPYIDSTGREPEPPEGWEQRKELRRSLTV